MGHRYTVYSDFTLGVKRKHLERTMFENENTLLEINKLIVSNGGLCSRNVSDLNLNSFQYKRLERHKSLTHKVDLYQDFPG